MAVQELFAAMDASVALPKEAVVEAKKRAELLFNELQAFAATLVPIPPNQEEEDQCMEDASGGRVTRRRIAMKSCGLSDSAKCNRRGMPPARLYEGPHRDVFASAHNASHRARLCINSESSRILEHRMQYLFRSCRLVQAVFLANDAPQFSDAERDPVQKLSLNFACANVVTAGSAVDCKGASASPGLPVSGRMAAGNRLSREWNPCDWNPGGKSVP